jgi:hypothetical protein
MEIKIPDEVVEAAARAEADRFAEEMPGDFDPWDALSAVTKADHVRHARLNIAAAIAAWPDVKWHTVQVPDDSDEVRYMLKKVGIILPMPQETSDE